MKFPKYKQIVNLIPGGCPQFLDFGLDTEPLRREARLFREETATEAQGQGRYPHYLRCLVDEDPDNPGMLVDMREARGTRDPRSGMQLPQTFAEDYDVRLLDSLECFKGEWLPLPFLRVTGQTWPDGMPRVERGPANWARGMLLPTDDDPAVWHLVVAFDTKIEDKPQGIDRYFALSQDDLNAASEFILAWHVRDNSWFVNEGWIDEWIHERWQAWDSGRRRFGDAEEDTSCLKHLACYMAWLDCVRRAVGDLRAKVTDPNRSDSIDVDLILDIGNSRTTGIMVETSQAKKTDLNDSYLLELRDLSNPNKSYSDPFETRVEFVDVSFGNDLLSRRSGRRTPAFAWPSCVRVGPEATRLSTFANCAEGSTGMSSPKRYLWDERKWTPSWRYNTHGASEPMVTRGLFPRQLNEDGTPLFCFESAERNRWLNTPALRAQSGEPLFGSYFTRSSLMMFMVSEIIIQALVNTNSPANRAKRQLADKPRRLKRVIFTVPTAMPVAERRIFQRWVELAVRLIWHGLGWDKGPQLRHLQPPRVLCEWDEASCSHLVLLYNEIMVKHLGNASQYFGLFGRLRPGADGRPHPSVRVASIDIGGGTTDLSITTHVLTSQPSESPRIEPRMEFRDGFNIAGDEVMREVIRTHVVPAIEKAVANLGVEARNATLALFGRYTQAKSEGMRTLQGQFVRQVAVPVALGILQACESLDQDDLRTFTCTFGDFFQKPGQPQDPKGARQARAGSLAAQSAQAVKEALQKEAAKEQGKDQTRGEADPDSGAAQPEEDGSTLLPGLRLSPRPQQGVANYFQNVLASLGAHATLDLMDIPVVFSLDAISEDIRRTLGDTLSSLCEMVHLYDADILLVTGRPSAWKGVIQTILAKTPLTPDRVVAMRSYHVGSWYPCADTFGCIADPKSTVVVGAILCALSSGYLEGINFDASHMHPSSTARFVGELNLQGQLEKDKIWFTVDNDGTVTPEEREITYHSPITIGYRQLAVDRWPASRYYERDFVDKKANASGPFAVRIKLNKDSGRMALAEDGEVPQTEGEINILEVNRIAQGGERMPLRPTAMTATLQTLPSLEGYWLDSGIIVSEG